MSVGICVDQKRASDLHKDLESAVVTLTGSSAKVSSYVFLSIKPFL